MGNGKFLFKLIIAGAGGSGKTTLLKRYTTGLFSGGTKMTIGVDFSVTKAKTEHGEVTLQIWDFGGEERFRTMLPSFCLGASGILIMFDPLRPATFHELDAWFTILNKNTNNVPKILLSSKEDLIKSGHTFTIPEMDIDDLIKKYNLIDYFHVSSKSGLNVEKSFSKIANLMIEKNL